MPTPLRTKRITELSDADVEALTHAFCIEWGEEYRGVIEPALKFLQENLPKWKVPSYPRGYIQDVLRKVYLEEK